MMVRGRLTESLEHTRSATQTLTQGPGRGPGRALPGDLSGSAGVERGQAIGRYLVLERLGAGAMGVVFAAYDPELDRKVALKVLHVRRGGEEAQARLVREAQALARVAHPGVVAVHDVGVHEGRVFLAMEYVAGQTLRSFLADPSHDLDARLRVMIAAGRGLAAAHAAGLVHRDFKPDNVMISARGEVKVMDFGLARAHDGASSLGAGGLGPGEDAGADAGEGASGVELSSPSARLAAVGELTEVGAVIGTPAYMAPEQLAGLSVDARSDQFAFAVTLFEAVYGVRPFSGANVGALAIAVGEGRIDEVPNPRRAPPWLRKVIVRGLAPDPGARWPELDALLHALSDAPLRRRRRATLAGFGGLAVVVGALAWLRAAAVEVPPPACSELRAQIEGRWDPGARAELAAALGEDPRAAAGAPTVLAALDRYASDWDAGAGDNCTATRVHASQSERVYDLRAACLRHRRIAFDELVEALVADPEARARAVEASTSLPSVAACSDLASLALEPEPPTEPEARARVEGLRDEIAAVDALIELGQVSAALTRATALARAAADTEHLPVIAEAELVLGRASTLADALAAGTASLRAAYFTATRAAHPRIQAEAAIELVYALGYLQQDHRLGREWADHAAAIVARIDEGGLLEADAEHVLSVLGAASGDDVMALRAATRAYEIRRSVLPEPHPDLARSLHMLGLVHHRHGQLEQALDYQRRAVAMRTELFGTEHPDVAGSLNNLALTQRDLGRYADAEATLERALDILDGIANAHTSGVPRTLTNLADIHRRLGKLDEARAVERRSLALRRETVGDAHPEVADSIVGLARIELDAGELDEAEALARDGLARLERDFAPGHPEIFAAAVVLARVLEARGAVDEGARLLGQMLARSQVDELEPEDRKAAEALLDRAGAQDR